MTALLCASMRPISCTLLLAAACAAWTVAWRLRTQHVTPLLLCLYPVFTLTQPPPSPHSVTGRCNDLIHQDILSPQCPVQCSQCGWRPGRGHVNFRLPTQQPSSAPAQPSQHHRSVLITSEAQLGLAVVSPSYQLHSEAVRQPRQNTISACSQWQCPVSCQ